MVLSSISFAPAFNHQTQLHVSLAPQVAKGVAAIFALLLQHKKELGAHDVSPGDAQCLLSEVPAPEPAQHWLNPVGTKPVPPFCVVARHVSPEHIVDLCKLLRVKARRSEPQPHLVQPKTKQ